MRCIAVLLVLCAAAGCGRGSPSEVEEIDPDAGVLLPGRIDVLVGERLAGVHLARAAWDDERAADLCLVVDAAREGWAGDGTVARVSAFSPRREPAAGGEVYLDEHLIGRAAEDGTFVFHRSRSCGDDGVEGRLSVRWRGQAGHVVVRSDGRTRSPEAYVISVSTDRETYDPGDVVRVEASARRLCSDEPLHDEDLRLELSDEHGRVVGVGLARIDGSGGASTTLRLPRITPEGRYTVALSIGRDRAEAVSVRVSRSEIEGGIVSGIVSGRGSGRVSVTMPASLVEMDEVEVPVVVRNLSSEVEEVEVSLTSPELSISRGSRIVTVAPGATEVAWFGVRAGVPGDVTFEASARGTWVGDVERGALFVTPRGNAGVETFRGEAGAGSPFSASFRLSENDRYHVARVGVALPTVVAGLQGLVHLSSLAGGTEPSLDAEVSLVLATTAVVRYLETRSRLRPERRAELRSWLADAGTSLLMRQNDDGGWGWFRGRPSNPFVTATALRALIEMRDLGFPVPVPAIGAAADSLTGSLGADGLLGTAAIAAWEGESDEVRLAGTAAIFDVLSRVPEDGRTERYGTAMRALAARFRRTLRAASPDPLVLAFAIGGLHRIAGPMRLRGVEPEVRSAAGRLSRILGDGRREAGWFLAYGGLVEATAVELEVLRDLDPEGFEALRPDSLQLVRSTQRSWGAWHNARGTAFGVRALLLLDRADDGVRRGILTVRVDGEEAARVVVDPDDPWGAALALREIVVETREPGTHEVVVGFDGAPAASVTLEVQRWSSTPNIVPLDAGRGGMRVQISRLAPEEMHTGAPVEVEWTVAAAGPVGPVVVRQPLPPGVAVDRASLDDQVRAGSLAAYEVTGSTLVMSFEPGETHRATCRLIAALTGRVTFAPASAIAMLRPDLVARSQTSMIVVR